MAASMSVRWCGVTSAVTLTPAALARAMAASDAAGADVADVHGRVLVGGDVEGARHVEALAERRDAGEAEARRHRALVHLAALHERVVLGVDGDEAAAHLDVLQGAARERGGGQRPAVVAEADRAGRAQLAHLGELLAVEAARDGGEEADGDDGLGARPSRRGRAGRRRCRRPGRCWPWRRRPRSRRRRRRASRWRGPPRPRARACAGARAGRRSPAAPACRRRRRPRTVLPALEVLRRPRRSCPWSPGRRGRRRGRPRGRRRGRP